MGSGARASSRRWLWLVLAVVVIGVLAWCTVSVMRAARAAETLRSDVQVAAGYARGMQTVQLADTVPAVAASAEEFSGAVSGPLWSVMARLPVVGSTAGSAQELAAASLAMSQAAEELAPALRTMEPDSIRGTDGAINLAALDELAEALVAVQPELREAADRAAAADSGAIGPVGDAVATAQDQLGDLPTAADGAVAAMQLAQVLLGGEGRQSWAVLLQNGSEARGTGGFLGAYTLLDTDEGRIDVTVVDTNNSLTTPIPNRDMPKEFLELWTREYTSEWNSYNLSRHFPYTGQLTFNGMQARGTPIDHVLAMDAHVVAALLAGTGPITAAGETIDATNAERFFNADVYARYPDVAQKDAVVVELMTALMDRVTSGSFDLPAALSEIVPAAGQGRMLVWSADDEVQARLEQYDVAGVVPRESGPWVATALNNSAANKLDAFVASSVDYQAATCGTGVSAVTVTLTNNAPDPATSPDSEAYSNFYYEGGDLGNTRMWTAVYGPVGAEFVKATINGKRQYVNEGQERGHPVWRWNLDIPRGESAELVVTFKESPSDDSALVSPQAMAVPQVVSTAQPPCS